MAVALSNNHVNWFEMQNANFVNFPSPSHFIVVNFREGGGEYANCNTEREGEGSGGRPLRSGRPPADRDC